MYNNVGLYSYGAAFFAYLVLLCALLLVWRNRSLSLSAVLATLMTSIWAGIVAGATLLEYPPVGLMTAAELTRNAVWLFLLWAFYGAKLRGTNHFLGSRRWLPWYIAGLATVVVILFTLPTIGAVYNFPVGLVESVIYGVWMTMSLSAVLLLENIYRNSNEGERWWVKYLCLGVGFIFAYDFFMYAGALLLQQLDVVLWQSRGFAVALAAPLIGLAAARSRDRKTSPQLSRHIVFHTFTLLAAGVYLIFMAVVGYFVSYLGGSWSGVLQITFLSATGLFLVALLFSSRVRARSRVWLSKHFFSYKYDYRREWLEFTQTLAEGGDDTPKAIIQAMAKLAGCRAGVIWTRSDDGEFRLDDEWMVSTPEGARNYPEFNRWLQETGWIIDVKEWREVPKLYKGLDMPAPLADAPGAWLVVPLMSNERLEAILMMRQSASYSRLNWEDRDLLKVAGRQAASHLAQYQSSRSLVELRQFETFNRLSAYVIHDLKNILAQQSLIVSNAARHRDNPAFFDDVIDTVSNSVERMTRLMEQMRSGMRGDTAEAVELSGLLREVVAARRGADPRPVLDKSELQVWVDADREQLATVCGHIVQNAREATTKHGRVAICLLHEDGRAVIEVKDDGIGMSAEFVKTRLFKPFDSTKGLTGMGIGVFESREFLRSLGGDLQVRSEESVGSTFRIVLPSIKRPTIINTAVEEAVSE
jgi:putative PEP-CTERM system histidine kinase